MELKFENMPNNEATNDKSSLLFNVPFKLEIKLKYKKITKAKGFIIAGGVVIVVVLVCVAYLLFSTPKGNVNIISVNL